METGGSTSMRPRELPPLPQRRQRTLPTTLSQDAAEVPQKHKKKSVRMETNDDVDGQRLEMESRRAFSVEERLSLEPATETAPRKKKKKKKPAPADLDDDQADLVNGDAADQNTDGDEVVRKPRKKKKSKAVEPQLPAELDIDEEDIITDAPPRISQHSLFSTSQSQPVTKVFVERNKHFKAVDRSEWRKHSDQMENMADLQHMQQLWTTREVSIRVHAGYRVFGLYCQGFLAGYAVWNMVVVYMLAGQHLTSLPNLLEQYHRLAYPSQSLFYMLLAISTVAAFDRANLAESSIALKEFLTLDPVAFASFLYFSALVLSLSQQMTSDQINLYPTFNTTLWVPGSERQFLQPWVTVNLVVALLVGLAWILIATRPDVDNTEDYLRTMEVEPPKPEDKSEMSA